MDGFLNWLRNISYDIIGILLPGFCFLLALPYTLASESSLVEFIKDFNIDPQNPDFLNVATICIASYLTGLGLKVLTSNVFLKNIYRSNLPSYGDAYKELYKSAIRNLEIRHPDTRITSWSEFYLLIKTHIMENSAPSTLITYQNRYELNSSLSLASLILATIQLVRIMMNWLNNDPGSITDFVQLALFILLFFVCRISFRKYWIEFGNQAIAHAICLKP